MSMSTTKEGVQSVLWPFSNQTLFGVQTTAARYSLIGFNIFLIFSSLFGDSIILIASIKYKAFQLHKFIVALIQQLAISDLTLTITLVTPRIVSLITDEWVFGDTFCYIQPYIMHLSYSSSIYFTLAMTTGKLIIVRYPLRARTCSRRRVCLICVFIWIWSLLLDIMIIIIDPKDAFFDYRTYICSFSFTDPIWKSLLPMVATLVGIFPTTLVIFTTLMLLWEARKVARRGRENLRLRGVLTVVLTAAVFTISFMPYTAYHIGAQFVPKDPHSNYHSIFFGLASTLMSINIMCNFYIYSLTVPSFRKFLAAKFGLTRRGQRPDGKRQGIKLEEVKPHQPAGC